MENKLNILINYHGKRGSGPSYSLEWAKGLLRCDCNVYAAISREVVNLEEWRNMLGDEHIFLVDTHIDYSRIDLVNKTIKLMLKGKKEVREKFNGITFDFSFHTFYCHWANLVDSFLSVKKIVAICHDPIAHTGTSFYQQYLFKRHYRKADDVFTLTKSFKETVHEQFEIPLEHIHYVPHGRMQMYNQYSKEMYDSLHFDSKKYTYLFFGFIEHYKGLNVLAGAYKKIREQRDDVSLIVAGNGDFAPYKDKFEGIKDVTIINRYIKDEEVGALFAGSNVISVLPYINATQSGVIPIAYEYLTPIIASDTGGLKEQLNDGKIGLLFECGSIDDLVAKMNKIADDQNEYHRQQRLMEEYRETLNWEALAQKLLKQIGYR